MKLRQSGNKIHERHDGEVNTAPWPSGNKIHERHDGEVKTVTLLEPDSCFKGESEQVTEASNLISD